MTASTAAHDLRAELDVMLTELGFQLADGLNGSHFQTWTRVSTDMTVHRQGDWLYVETSARPAYPVACIEHVDLETVLTRALLHAHDDEPDVAVTVGWTPPEIADQLKQNSTIPA